MSARACCRLRRLCWRARALGSSGAGCAGAGLALTFGLVGGALASFGVEFGDSYIIRAVSAVAMIAIGAALLFPSPGEVVEARLGVSAVLRRAA